MPSSALRGLVYSVLRRSQSDTHSDPNFVSRQFSFTFVALVESNMRIYRSNQVESLLSVAIWFLLGQRKSM